MVFCVLVQVKAISPAQWSSSPMSCYICEVNVPSVFSAANCSIDARLCVCVCACVIECMHLLAGLSVSSRVSIDFPSMSGGVSRPAMSRMVGARSMLRTICGLLIRTHARTHKHIKHAPLFPCFLKGFCVNSHKIKNTKDSLKIK